MNIKNINYTLCVPMKKILASVLLAIVLLSLIGGLTSCQPRSSGYHLLNDSIAKLDGGGSEEIKATDTLMLKKYLDLKAIAWVKNTRNKKEYWVDSKTVFNWDTGVSLYEDQQLVDQGNLWEERVPKLEVSKETKDFYKRNVVITTSLLVVLVIVGASVLTDDSKRWKIGILYLLISVVSLAANTFYFLYSISVHGHGFYAYLFSPKEYGWWYTILFWIAFFVLSAANLLCYRATVVLSEMWSGRKFYSAEVFTAILVWAVVYLFSSNALNDQFLWALYAIMVLHFLALLVTNLKVKANFLEMLYIYVYFWGCMLPVVESTLSTIVLIPVLLFAFVFIRSTPSMIREAIRIDTNPKRSEKEKKQQIIKGEKMCQFCQYYNYADGYCELQKEKREHHDGAAYSCPYYS